jgi:hypothetical protein
MSEMADRFDAHADELGALVTKENGKILAQGMFESTTVGGTPTTCPPASAGGSRRRRSAPRLFLEPEDPLGIHVRHSLLVSGSQRRGSDELDRLFGGLKGVVDREHHPVGADFLDRGGQ